ncbi:SURF1 family cytochrome oxidase biogenesis protein [Leifsonia shinshuensis]|uniref:SURF1 family protein n=1 Tax=Leifsonia shinshuensis TaxID=150026 RepID=UPI00286371EA|nr:SURF1 family cytochrome oxidase biogenesis protein [Leifsonia shinshuensis]MDR6971429.1 cytochrome oxidase assembly protein ShyY1 [Leifsonia shinshuensis]
MMLRPRWIAALVFALLLAAGFAWLGQWQLERAVESGKAVEAPTETVLPLAKVAGPGAPLRDVAVGQLVSFTGTFVPGDYQLLHGRLNKGASGWWVVGHANVERPDGSQAALAVARGWAADEPTARAAIARLAEEPATPQPIVGRILPDEQPQLPDDKEKDPTGMTSLGVGQLYNLWTGVDGMDVYASYVVQRGAPEGLVQIYSPPPIAQTELNWLNVFYAAEWIIFAGFAVFLWYRLVKDAKQKEDELRELSAQESATAGNVE